MGRVRIRVVDRHPFGLEYRLRADGLARVIEVAGQFGLAIERHRPPDQPLEVDPKDRALVRDKRPFVDDALALQPVGDACLAQQVDDPALQHAGPDPGQNVILRAPLQYHRLDPAEVQELAQQQPGRPSADDDDLHPHQAGPVRATAMFSRTWRRSSSATRMARSSAAGRSSPRVTVSV